jgi:DNA-binding NarL/FixJ family response regulator
MKALLADDHPLMLEAVRQILLQLDPQLVLVEAENYPGLFRQASRNPDLDLALVDLNMPGLPGLHGIREFRSRFPAIPLVVLSASQSPVDIRSTIDAGALGYIPKASTTADILSALRQVLAGQVFIPHWPDEANSAFFSNGAPAIHLTKRQLEVLRLMQQGCPNKVIAHKLDLTEGTVKVHVAAIFGALGVRNRTEAVLTMQQLHAEASLAAEQA